MVYTEEVPLTPQQAEAIRVLDWLLDENEGRRTGRSTVMAVALIRQALRYPGRQIFYLDHTSGYPPVRERALLVRGLVEGLVNQDPALHRLPWAFLNTHFSLTADSYGEIAALPHNWLPDLAPAPGSLRELLEFNQQVGDEARRLRYPSFWQRLMAGGEDVGEPLASPKP
jgi:hypothetical protein